IVDHPNAGHPVTSTKTSGKGACVCRHDRDKIALPACFLPDSPKFAAVGGALDRAAIQLIVSFYMVTALHKRYTRAAVMPGAVPLACPVELVGPRQCQQKPNESSQDRSTDTIAEINIGHRPVVTPDLQAWRPSAVRAHGCDRCPHVLH